MPDKNKLVIEKIWAWVSVDDDGNEGICAFSSDNGMMMPMIAADEERLESLRGIAEDLSKMAPDRKFRLLKFSTREEVETL
jgi:hypothetical protein